MGRLHVSGSLGWAGGTGNWGTMRHNKRQATRAKNHLLFLVTGGLSLPRTKSPGDRNLLWWAINADTVTTFRCMLHTGGVQQLEGETR